MASPGTLEIVLQGGALGVLLLVLVGLFVLTKLLVPPLRDFLVGLVAEQRATTAALGALTSRIELAEERVKAHVSAVAHGGVEDEVRGLVREVGEVVRQATNPDLMPGDLDAPRRPSSATPVRANGGHRAALDRSGDEPRPDPARATSSLARRTL